MSYSYLDILFAAAKNAEIQGLSFIYLFLFNYYFVYLSRKCFVKSVLISERLIFLKLVFKAFWSRFESDKHLLNTEKQPDLFFFLIHFSVLLAFNILFAMSQMFNSFKS